MADSTFSLTQDLKTLFVKVAVPLSSSPRQLRDAIDEALRSHGQPLRWAIARVEQVEQHCGPSTRVAHVEAIVTIHGSSQPDSLNRIGDNT